MLTRAISSLEPAAFSPNPERASGSIGRVGTTPAALQPEDPGPSENTTASKETPSAKRGFSPALDDPNRTESLQSLAEQVNKNLNPALNLRFRKDETTGIDFFQIVDKKSGEVIRQYPPEEFLQMVESFREVSGLLFSDEV